MIAIVCVVIHFYREITKLRSKVRGRLQSASLTKASMLQCETMRKVCSVALNVWQVSWKDACVTDNSIGKGVFAECYAAHVGAVCIKLLTAGDKYKWLFYS